jgi:hypothetical protein
MRTQKEITEQMSDLAETMHLPGPYEFSNGAVWGTSPWNARVRLATITTFAPLNGISSDALGTLFAAAPAMLKALERARVDINAAIVYVECHEEEPGFGLRQTLEKIETAIAAAKRGV